MEVNNSLLEAASRLISVEEASKLLKIKKDTLHNWLSMGKYKRIKLHGRTYIDKLEIEASIVSALSGGGKS